MLRRLLIVTSLTLMLVLVAEPIQPVQGVVMTAAEIEMVNASPAPDNSTQKHENAFVRALKAPFKAIGRLFGAGKKDDNKLQRLSEKDVKRFETVPAVRVVDARLVPTETEATNGASPLTPTAQPTNVDQNSALALEHLQRGKELLNDGQAGAALNELALAISLNAKLSEAHNLLGVAYETKGMRANALESFKVALREDKNNAEYLNNMGYLLFKNGDYDKAAKYLKRAVKRAPDQQRYWNNLGLVQSQRGKFDQAYEAFARAVGEYEGHMNVATRLQIMGYEKDAIEHLEAARELQPNVALILVRLANLYTRAGKTEQAEEARRALTELQSMANAASPQN